MSGHSKWHRIKRKKEVTDSKRGAEFTKLAGQIKQATRSGSDPARNAALAEAIARAKKANMPQSNIDRLLSQSAASSAQEVIYESFGPGGSAILIITNTDNPNRTVAEVRHILKKHGASLGSQGSVTWKFQRQGQSFSPLYPQNLSPADHEKVEGLIGDLNNHPDVGQIVTDAVK